MKKSALGIVLLTCGVPYLFASSTPLFATADVPQSASGEGVISFDKHGHGYLLFEVERGENGISGSLLFAGEDHHDGLYPDIIVRLKDIEKVVFGERSVEIKGKGRLHDQTVYITSTAYDGEGTENADQFSITCTDGKGKVVFEAEGDLTSGDVQVGEPN